ncbi:hypothetical protein OG897_13535 [Streptomyces sp. NBC_00237]|uniref:hypothetical protein n=1 Tax=Streptomyces sp. NBC_00237 TaxID=2975687 RepID=UPI0022525BA9|nr:hypothetical protein [Streptomyces sp. NBC_00237]MCX5202466.1 hypothetical protein [Streptomyces sp. NBC_00237]
MSKYKSVDAYIEARQAGDDERCREITAEVMERFATRTTDGSEGVALYEANRTVPLAKR